MIRPHFVWTATSCIRPKYFVLSFLPWKREIVLGEGKAEAEKPPSWPIGLLPSTTKLRRLCFYRCVSVHMGGVCLSACWDTRPHTWEQTPPPPEQTPPGSRHSPRADIPPGADPLEQTRADGTHPTGMHSCYKNILISLFPVKRTNQH